MRKWFSRKGVLCFFVLLVLFSQAGELSAAEDRAARLISLRGQVQAIIPSSSGWQDAAPGMKLPHGSMVKTGEDGVASLLMADETLIKLNRNTRFLIKEASNNAGWNRVRGVVSSSFAKTKVKLEKGEAWFLNKNKAADLEVETSTVTAAIRGTEFNIRMSPDATVEVAVLEGSVRVGNDQGQLSLGGGEVAVTRPGSGPVKRLLIQTDDSVQWTIVIPSLFSSRDLKLVSQNRGSLLAERERLVALIEKGSTDTSDLIRYGMILRDLGMFEEARIALEEVLRKDPDNGQARTAMAWVMLDENEYGRARENFINAGNKAPETVAGLALALDGLERRAEAEKLVKDSKGILPGIVKAWFELSSGRVNAAAGTIKNFVGKGSRQAVAWEISSLVSLALGKSDKARAAADKAVTLLPWSPTPRIISAYIDQADHNLDGAALSLRVALELERDNVTAILGLARIKFGQGYIAQADRLLNRAANLAPENSEVLNLRGFVKLAGRDDRAGEMFAEAIRVNPAMAEPYLGNALVLMREGDEAGALEEISKAVLHDPRRAILRSYWAKMLYQMERYQKALDVLDIARNIDPKDPTPELYRALALKDLNRPSEAIASLQRAISLNDNRAVYRSRFLLDQDLAVKNVNLAQLFYGLEAIDWATSIAAKSIKTDYSNSSAHLFYAGALLLDPERLMARNTENLLARLMQPANNNTFNSFNEYTSFLETPALDGSLRLKTGNMGTQGQQMELSGSAPGANLAGQLMVYNEETDGWRDTNYQKSRQLLGYIKWDITPGHNLLLSGQTNDMDIGDVADPRNEYDAPSEPRDHRDYKVDMYEVGYYYKPDPAFGILFHYRRADVDDQMDIFDETTSALSVPPFVLDLAADTELDFNSTKDFEQIQGQFAVTLGSNQFMVGALNYEDQTDMTYDLLRDWVIVGGTPTPPAFLIGVVLPDPFSLSNTLEREAQTCYIHDIVNLTPDLMFEGAYYFDRMETGNILYGTTWDLTEYSPRLGMAWDVTKGTTARIAGFRYLRPFNIAERIEPVDIAGIPVYRNGREGEAVEEVATALEFKWSKVFASVGVFSADSSYEERLVTDDPLVENEGKTKGGTFKLNLLPFDGVGISFNYLFKDIKDAKISTYPERKDQLAILKATWVNRSGFSTGMIQTFRQLDYDDNTVNNNEKINVTDLWMSYQLPNRKAIVEVEANNIFDSNFNWVTDYYSSSRQARVPGQELFMTVNFYF